jgi:hypothetical protein
MDYKTVENRSVFMVYRKTSPAQFSGKTKTFYGSKTGFNQFYRFTTFFIGFESLNTMAIMTARPHGYIGELYAEM